MWDDECQRQLNELARRAEAGVLTATERQQLDALLARLDEAESARLMPALRQLQQEKQQLQAEQRRLQEQNTALAALIEKYEDLLARARTQLETLSRERNALRGELERVLR